MRILERLLAPAAIGLAATGLGGCDSRAESANSALSAESKKPDDCCSPKPAADGTNETRPAKVRANIPDVELVDQDGKRHRFFSELIEGKMVLLNAIYTNCTGTCPAQSSIFASVQHRLLERLGKDVRMLSISLDPTRDTPQRLKEFSERFTKHPGWLFLTGDPENVKAALESMDLYTSNAEDHVPLCVMGNERAGVWMKVLNLSGSTEIVKKFEHLATLTGPPVPKRR